MNFLPTMTKLFIAGCCALIAFTTMGDKHQDSVADNSGAGISGILVAATTSTTTTTVATTSTIPDESYVMIWPNQEAPHDPLEEFVIATTTTTIAIVQKSANEWGIVPDDAMEFYDKQYSSSHQEIGKHEGVPYLIDNMYGFWEKGSHIVDLQRMLGMDFVDGIYGPSTRRKHMEWFGSFEVAQRYFFDRDTWYMETIEPDSSWVHNWANWDEPPTLEQLVDIYFQPEDKEWALRVAFCESSASPTDTYSNAVSSALAVGWYQHLSKFWLQRSQIAGWQGYDIFDTEPNVAVAAWLFYKTGGAERHWNPSRSCWKDTPHGQ